MSLICAFVWRSCSSFDFYGVNVQKLVRMSRPSTLITAFHNSETLINPASHLLFQNKPDSHQVVITKKPFLVIWFVPSEKEDVGLDDSRTVWADSVKKKRKKKMNKHKYRKLRKRLGRQI